MISAVTRSGIWRGSDIAMWPGVPPRCQQGTYRPGARARGRPWTGRRRTAPPGGSVGGGTEELRPTLIKHRVVAVSSFSRGEADCPVGQLDVPRPRLRVRRCPFGGCAVHDRGRAEQWVASEGQLGGQIEHAGTPRLLIRCALQEHRLEVTQLLRDLQHLPGSQAVGVQEDRQAVAVVRRGGEDVDVRVVQHHSTPFRSRTNA